VITASIEPRATKIGRFYDTPDGTFPSVTTILQVVAKPALVNWAASTERELVLATSYDVYSHAHSTPVMSRSAWMLTMQNRLGKEKAHRKELAKAGEIGSQVHGLIKWTLRAKLCQEAGPSPHISDKAMWAFMVFEDWAKSVKLEPILIEQVVWSKTHGYAGTLDLLANVSGIETLVDFKTGKAVYREAHAQIASYRSALEEMGHGHPKQSIIVRLPKDEQDPEPRPVVADDDAVSFEAFLHAKKLWEWVNAEGL
jgi:hypothetical protein